MRINYKVLALMASLGWTSGAAAHEYVCQQGSVKRMISVQHEVPGQEVPCIVKYDKPAEGKTEFPWRADHSAGYCEEKADYLANRLEGFGWSCERTDMEAAQPAAGEAEQPAMGAGQPAAGPEQPGTEETPDTGAGQPATGSEQPGTEETPDTGAAPGH